MSTSNLPTPVLGTPETEGVQPLAVIADEGASCCGGGCCGSD